MTSVAAWVLGPAAPSYAAGDPASQVTSIQVTNTQPFGPFATGTWTRIWGTVSGVVGPADGVVGFESLPIDADGLYHYTSQFEVIVPDAAGVSSKIVVDAENRGNPGAMVVFNEVTLSLTGVSTPATVSYPPQLGNGFLQDNALSFGRVQWQNGITASVPATVQGIGLVIFRDFARLLTEPSFADLRGSAGIPSFEQTIVFGGSQSAWFVNAFLAESYNASPQTGSSVFDGVFELNGAGNWLAINQLAADTGVPQRPFVGTNSVPLLYDELLADPNTAPSHLVDVVKLTDYYRLRASVSLEAPIPASVHRYDVAAPHANLSPGISPALLFTVLGCNFGVPVPLNPISTREYERALMLDLVADLRFSEGGNPAGRRLPPSAVFEQAPAPPGSDFFNALPGHTLTVPAAAESGMPIGGVELPDQVLPLGRPSPVALPHVGTLNINDGCGNFGGWVPFTASELASRYRSLEKYKRAVRPIVNGLADHRFLARDDIEIIVQKLAAQYQAAPQ